MINSSVSTHKPELSALQRAWLKEIGLDARALRQFGFAPQGIPGGSVIMPTPVQSEQAAGQRRESLRQHADQDTLSVDHHTPSAPLQATAQNTVKSSGPEKAAQPLQPSHRNADSQPHTEPSPQPLPVRPPEQTDSLVALQQHASECVSCGLHAVRGRVVFGEGAERSPQWMFIGEAPGEYDDSTGRPFQGRAGELLQAMLAAAGMQDAGSSYFTNILKCRPVGNRLPDQAEINACMPWLHQQIRLLQPGCLVALGKVAAAALLGEAADVAALRGRVHTYKHQGSEIPVIVTHHPASLLLHGALKAEAWRDLHLIRSVSASVPARDHVGQSS